MSPEGSSVASSQEEWNENIVEPELEFDEMGLELAAEDGKMLRELKVCLLPLVCVH